MANKNKNTVPSPFHKKGSDVGDHKRNWFGRTFTMDRSKWTEDEVNEKYGILDAESNMDKAFSDFQGLKEGASQNLWAGAENLMNINDNFGNLENTAEDFSVGKSFDFQRDMAAQQNQATLSALSGSAGGSGAAALAQQMSNIQSNQQNQLGGQIQKLETANRAAAASQASQNQLATAQARQQTDMAISQGAMEAQKFKLQGAADARELQIQMQQGELSYLAGLKEAAQANQDADDAGKSDRRLKKNINKIGRSASGLNIYSFEYKNPLDGEGLFQGVMSDEVPQEAVINNGEYDMVNYGMLDVEFKQI